VFVNPFKPQETSFLARRMLSALQYVLIITSHRSWARSEHAWLNKAWKTTPLPAEMWIDGSGG